VIQPTELDGEVPLSELIRPLRTEWRRIAAVTLAGVVIALILWLVLPAKYTAETTFTANQGRSGISLPSGLAGLAGSLGLSVNEGGGGGPSPDFLIRVLASREVLLPLLDSTFTPLRGDDAGKLRKLIDLIGAKGKTPRARQEDGLVRLRKAVTASADRRSGVLTVSVATRDPDVSATLANDVFALLNHYSVERLQSLAHDQRVFAEDRLTQARAELADAEQQQLRFLQTNRLFAEAPVLQLDAARLQRLVELKQEIVLTLAKSYEESRIAEARATPMLIMVDRAVPPLKASSPRGFLLVVGGLVAGLLVGVVVVIGRVSVAA
jgi:uncharacterized protein involved in exopolysaccharide biosynthesis